MIQSLITSLLLLAIYLVTNFITSSFIYLKANINIKIDLEFKL